jgi:hypothetical protein
VEREVLDALRLLAASQHGLFTVQQARELGVTLMALRTALARGWLRQVRRGVYAFAGRLPSQWEPILAAALAAGPTAVISHRSAAAMHGFWGVAAGEPELTVPTTTGRSMTGVRIHRSAGLLPQDIVRRAPFEITSPIRTLLDLAPSTNDYLLPRIIDEGAIARLWTAERITERLDASGDTHRASVGRLRCLLAERRSESNPDSPLEQRVIRTIKPWLPPFGVHHRVTLGGRIVELDVAWPEYLLAAEIDGRKVRAASVTKFESDRLRSNLLELSGWQLVHITAGMDDLTILAQLVPFFPAGLIDRRLRADIARRAAIPARRG